jgi:hypothetical protein
MLPLSALAQTYPSPTFNSLTLLNPLSAANGGTGATTSTGTGAAVLATSPTLVTPNLGTPSAVTLTNATGLPASTGLTGTSLPSGITGSSLTSVGTLTSGAIGVGFTAIPNSALANSSTTINGTVCALGSSCVTGASPIPNASGSVLATTGTISASSTTLTLASAGDFKNGQGIMIAGVGAAFATNQPTSATVSPQGTTGSTTYEYQIASVDSAGGIGVAIGGFITTSGNATLSCTGSANNYNLLSWSAPSSGPTPAGYAVYGRTNTSLTLMGFTNNTTFYDCGSPPTLPTLPIWAPSTPLATASHDWLLTTISSGGGTTSLTLANAATVAGTSTKVIHDDTAALQTAIANLPANGGVVDLGTSAYPISSPLTIGNGTASSGSTTRGVLIKGDVPATGGIFWPAYQAGGLVGAHLVWQGSPINRIITIAGPLQGWGVQNLDIDCNNIAQFGMYVASGQFGDSANILFNECFYGLYSTTYAVFGPNNTDALHNYYRNITINPPWNGYSVGMYLTGGNGTSDTDYNHIDNLMFGAPEQNYEIGLIMGQSDSNVFTDVQTGGSVSAITFQYGSGVGPSANIFFGIDPGANSSTFINNSGSPSGQATNYFYGTLGANGGTCPTLANLTCK